MQRIFPFALLMLVLVPAPCYGDQHVSRPEYRGWGLRVGAAADPDQLIGGVHWNLGEFVDNVRFQPSLELGLGDDVTSLVATVPVFYRFDVQGEVAPYVGGGLALGLFDVDRGPFQGDDTDFEIGLRIGGGAEWRLANDRAFFVELDLGIGDTHDAVIVAGWLF